MANSDIVVYRAVMKEIVSRTEQRWWNQKENEMTIEYLYATMIR